MDEVEAKLLEWLRLRHSLLPGQDSMAAMLGDCIRGKAGVSPALLRDLAQALDDLEQIQRGYY